MILYHGGSVEISSPDLLHSRKAVDFGVGFYVTPVREQAEKWSEKRKRRTGTAVISKYEFDECCAENLKMLRFDSYSEAIAKPAAASAVSSKPPYLFRENRCNSGRAASTMPPL